MYYDNEFEFSPENEYDPNAVYNGGRQFEEEYEYDTEYDQENEFEEEGDFEGEYEYDPSFETGPDYESEIRVTDHRGGVSSTITRPAYRPAAAPGSYYYRTPVQRTSTITRPVFTAGNRTVYTRRPAVNNPWINRSRYPYFNRPYLPLQRRTHWPYNRYPWYRRPGYLPVYTAPYGMNAGAVVPPPPSFQTAPMQDNMPMPGSNSINEQILSAIQNLAVQMSSLKQTMAEPHPAGPLNEPAQQPVNEPAPGKENNNEFEFSGGGYEGEVYDSESSFNEVTEMELASELLSVNTEAELDHFLGKLLQKAIGSFSGFMRTGQGKALKNLLRNVAKTALPMVGTAAGAYFGGPLGAQAGGNVGKTVSSMFELELEGLSNEDREFEVAKAVVRLAGNAAKQAADNVTGDAGLDARNALIQAASRFAPGLLVRKGTVNNQYSRYDSSAWGGGNGF